MSIQCEVGLRAEQEKCKQSEYTQAAGNAHIDAQQGKKHVTKEFESIASKLSGTWA